MEELLEKLIAFKTTEDNPQEIKRGFEYISSLFDPQKFNAQLFEKSKKYSLLVSLQGKDSLKPAILLNGHFDVVPAEDESQYKLRIEAGKAYGRGALDMKGMIVVLIKVMQELGMQGEPPDAALLLTGDEEIGGMDGAGYMAQEIGLRPKFVVCADGASEKGLEIVTKGKGGVWLELNAQGKSAHGAYLWQGENAIEKVIAAVQKIKDFIGKVEAEAWKTTANLGIIDTPNKTPNKVPSQARAVLDIRFTEAIARTPEELIEKVKALAPEIQIKVLEKFPLFFTRDDDELLQRFKKAAEEVLNSKVPITYSHGAADIRYFTDAGSGGVLFGSLGEGMHAANEWVDLKSLEVNRQVLLRFFSGNFLT